MKEFTRESGSEPERSGHTGARRNDDGVAAGAKLVMLRGDLGAGKNDSREGHGSRAGSPSAEDVTSPTFTLVHEYQGRKVRLFHLDLYRLRASTK